MPASISNESVEMGTKDTESGVVLTRKRKAVRRELPSRKSPRRSGNIVSNRSYGVSSVHQIFQQLSEDEKVKLLETEPKVLFRILYFALLAQRLLLQEISEEPAPPSVDAEEHRVRFHILGSFHSTKECLRLRRKRQRLQLLMHLKKPLRR